MTLLLGMTFQEPGNHLSAAKDKDQTLFWIELSPNCTVCNIQLFFSTFVFVTSLIAALQLKNPHDGWGGRGRDAGSPLVHMRRQHISHLHLRFLYY